jgi:hypothetical protein
MARLPGLAFIIVCPDGSGRIRRISVEDRTQSPIVSCSKTPHMPVLAYPWVPGDGARAPIAPGVLRPAGGLFPIGVEFGSAGGSLALRWEYGPVAELFLLLHEAGMDVGLVDAERLLDLMGNDEDPWRWDIEGIASQIASGDFNAYDIDPLPRKMVRLRAGPGTWLLEDPFRAPMMTDPEGCLEPAWLPFGRHSFLGPDGMRLDVYLDERGAVVLPITANVRF